MYGSNENYYGTLIPPLNFDVGEARNMLPSASNRNSEQPPPPTQIPVDIATSLAYQLSAAANGQNPNGPNGNELIDRDKLNYCSVPPTGLEYPSNCYPPPQSNSPADYNAILLSRGAPSNGNNTFYPGNSWPYPNPNQEVDGVYPHPAGPGYPPGDTLQSAPYNAQFGDRMGVNGSPYMMYSNGNADDLVERFNCVSLNDAMSAQQHFLFPTSSLNQNEQLIDSHWQHFVGKDRNGYPMMGSGTNRPIDRYPQQDGCFAMNGDVSRAWSLLSGMKPLNNAGPNPGDICNWPLAKRSTHFGPNDLASVMASPELSSDLVGIGYRNNRYRPRVQKNGERPLPSAPRGIIRNGVYERFKDNGNGSVVASTNGTGDNSASTVSKTSASNGSGGDSLQARLMRQINPPNFNSSPSRARFFVIKSFSEDDIHRSIKYSIWCSTEAGNKKLNAAYTEASAAGIPIYLFFSVNGSGHFCGVAEMTSGVDYATRAGVWAQDKWQGQFSVKWLFVKDVSNAVLRHIHVETNDNKPVTHSRDTTEVPLEQGQQVLEIFAKYVNSTSILDDFDYYERREQQELQKTSTNE
ncbi:unnamed protein product [Rodentolepis nana]|uniref:YTH domain-containing protein n=1 Tax=Rodentolepis nana TaxID=102285 RepID=A0A158QH71_RODNA|nr:unnamed protein product [Rodentolepis nana]